MKDKVQIAISLVAIALVTPAWVQAQPDNTESTAPNPLAPFERLIGGQWHLEGSYQEFEWGVGRRSVKARGYFLVDGKPKLVSEGAWFWHPEEKRIKGIFTAIDMPVEVFEYATRFEGDTIVSELAAYDAAGAKSAYTEKWDFVDETHFVWTLSIDTPDGPQEEMGGTYAKKQ